MWTVRIQEENDANMKEINEKCEGRLDLQVVVLKCISDFEGTCFGREVPVGMAVPSPDGHLGCELLERPAALGNKTVDASSETLSLSPANRTDEKGTSARSADDEGYTHDVVTQELYDAACSPRLPLPVSSDSNSSPKGLGRGRRMDGWTTPYIETASPRRGSYYRKKREDSVGSPDSAGSNKSWWSGHDALQYGPTRKRPQKALADAQVSATLPDDNSGSSGQPLPAVNM